MARPTRLNASGRPSRQPTGSLHYIVGSHLSSLLPSRQAEIGHLAAKASFNEGGRYSSTITRSKGPTRRTKEGKGLQGAKQKSIVW